MASVPLELVLLVIIWDYSGGIILNGLPTETAPVTQTTCGPVKGRHNGNAYSFRGIPYALPPIGDRRWQYPAPVRNEHCWTGTYDATEFKNQCVQRAPFNRDVVIGSEDCLYLNVWTPTLDKTANLPVFVYIHGGSLQEMNSSVTSYSPTEELARDTNIVYVSMNYRLQAFGFMALKLLSDSSPSNTSGNYGFMDQIQAMQWVKENIQNFGGNPNSVALAGQSSGGTSIFAILASPLAKGLFHRAWLISASPILKATVRQAERENIPFLVKSGCHDIRCLRRLTAEEVSRAVPWDIYPYWAMDDQETLPVKGHLDGAIAIVDGYVVKEAPFDAWLNGHAIDVPLMISTTAQEVDMDPGPADQSITQWTWPDYDMYVKQRLDTFGEDISKMALKMYPRVSTPVYQFTSMASDLRVNCPNDIMALYASVNTASPVYRYVLTATPSQPLPFYFFGPGIPSRYAFHAFDMLAFFGSIKDFVTKLSATDSTLQNTLQQEMLSFVRTGRPHNQNWHPFPSTTALIDNSDEVKFVNGYNAQQCHYWLEKGFFDYAWIN